MTIDAAAVAANLDRVHQAIAAAGGDLDRIAVLAVTKGFGPGACRAAIGAGLGALGENYAQELLEKADDVQGAEWHFIGRLQSNKVRLLADTVTCWQSVDRASLVAEIAKRAPGARVLIQVNATSETHKGGCPPDQVGELVAVAREGGLNVTGLMTVGVDGDLRATGVAFDRVRALVDDLGLRDASMGMTADLEVAVGCGTTMVRVGRALFGPRPTGSDHTGRPAHTRDRGGAVRD